MKYFLKNIRTSIKSRPFGSKEALESYLSEFNRYSYDNDHKRYKYVGNWLLDGIVGTRVSNYNRNAKRVKQLIDANETVFCLPDFTIGVSQNNWRLKSILGEQSAEELALESLMTETALRDGLYSKVKLYIKDCIIIVDEKGKVYDYTDFIVKSKAEDKEYFKRVYEETKKKNVITFYNWRWLTAKPTLSEFRSGAVPFTGHYKHRRKHKLGVASHERWLDVEDVREYAKEIEYIGDVKAIRSKRKRIYASYSTPASHSSWKEKKCRKQWMRGEKGIKIEEKRVYIEEVEEI